MERDITITHTRSCELKKVSVEPVDHPVSVDEVKRTAAVTFYRPLRPPLLVPGSSLSIINPLRTAPGYSLYKDVKVK